MSEERVERQVNVKELFFNICVKWRSIIGVFALTLTVALIINMPAAMHYVKQLGTSKVIMMMISNGMAVGTFASIGLCIIYLFKYITSDKIKSVADYQLNCDIKLIGAIPDENIKRNSAIDRFLKKCNGIKMSNKDRDGYIDRVANILRVEMKIRDCYENTSIAVVGVCSQNVEGFIQLIGEKVPQSVTFIPAGDVLISSDSVDSVMRADYVLMVEREGETKYSELDSAYKMILSWKKDIIGLVLMGVEAV